MSCICLCKDTNFKANHNLFAPVCIAIQGCICLCKDTNFKANHNFFLHWCSACPVVYAYAKILILKQITTATFRQNLHHVLYMPMQRY